jgi:N-acetylneuraminic acid mutarotase
MNKFLLYAVCILACCFFKLTVSAQITTNSQWTWMKGDNTIDQNGVYGTQGTAAAANKPGARDYSATWTDASNNLWLFGGFDHNYNYLNDLWKYNPSTNQWTWIKGDNIVNQYGIYGTKGVPAAANKPGGRNGSVSWIDATGKLWLFGGYGFAESGASQFLNDLWKYDPATNQWAWIKGDNVTGKRGVYGSLGVAAASNNPGGRGGNSWIDASGNLWLFGGEGWAAPSSIDGELNDLWKYTPSTNLWTWIKGDSTSDQSGIYGTMGIASAANKPGGRDGNASWIDGSGNLWLFGGVGYPAGPNPNELNDLWKYNPTTNQWTWVKGDNTIDQPGIYGTIGVTASTNKPGGRQYSTSWKDASGNLWLFGGYGIDVSTGHDHLNDLWKYDPITNQWTWVKGDNTVDQSGIYGTQGVAALSNKPGSRGWSAFWIDGSSNFWMLGGEGYATSASVGLLNDLWKIGPAPSGFVWIGVTSTDWTLGSNWSEGVVPGATDDVTIPSGTPFNATVPNGLTVSVRSLTITTGAQVFVGTNAHLNVTH